MSTPVGYIHAVPKKTTLQEQQSTLPNSLTHLYNAPFPAPRRVGTDASQQPPFLVAPLYPMARREPTYTMLRTTFAWWTAAMIGVGLIAGMLLAQVSV